MNLRENAILAIEGLRHNKMRALLTMLGIIIGISSVITILSIGNAVTTSISDMFSVFGGKTISVSVTPRDLQGSDVTPEDSDLITSDMIAKLKVQFPGEITDVGISSSVGMANTDNYKKSEVSVIAINPDYTNVEKVNILKGRNFNASDVNSERAVVIISDTLSESYFGRDDAVGETLGINLKGQRSTYKVVGIYQDPKKSAKGVLVQAIINARTDTMYLPISLANTLNDTNVTGYNSLSVAASSSANLSGLTSSIGDWFNRRYYAANGSFYIETYNNEDSAGQVTGVMSGISLAVGIIAGISLLVGGIGVMNIMLVSVTERTKEIGIRKALGASNNDIRLQFIVESIIICVIGGAIGVLLGTILGAIAAIFIQTTIVPSLTSIIISVLFSMAIGVFFGYYPANRAAKMHPIDALRYE
jgi:putative ABC transport system permease protein